MPEILNNQLQNDDEFNGCVNLSKSLSGKPFRQLSSS